MSVNSVNFNNNIPSVESKVSSTNTASPNSIMAANSETEKLLKKLDLTQDELMLLISKYPDFKALQIDKQLELVNNLKTEMRQASSQKLEDANNGNSKPEQSFDAQDNYGFFNKSEFNKLSTVKKVDACVTEFVKSQYIYGTKNHSGGYISEPHSEEQWDALTPEQRHKLVEKFKASINSSDKFEQLKLLINLPDDANLEKAEDIGTAADIVMNGIQTANKEGVSYVEFMHKDDAERYNAIDEYLNEAEQLDPESLNEADREYISHWKLISSQVSDIVGKEKGLKDLELCPSDARQYIKYYNLNEEQLLYDALKAKQDKGVQLTSDEEAKLADLNRYVNTPAGQREIKKSRAANLEKLQAEYDAIKTKQTKGEALTSEEQGLLSVLEERLNPSDVNAKKELEELKAFQKAMPKPETEFEKSVVNDLEVYGSEIKEHIKGSNMEAGAVKAFIDKKCKGMTPEQRAEYVKTAVKFYNGSASSKLFAMYSKKYPELLKDGDLIGKAALATEYLNKDQYSTSVETMNIGLKSDNKFVQEEALAAAKTSGIILQAASCSGVEHDDKKVIYSSKMAAGNENVEIQKLGYDVATTIDDVDKQDSAVIELQAHENAKEELQVYAANNADKLKGKAQITSLDIATQKSEKATAAAAENGIVAKLDKENQTKVFSMVRNRIEQQFNEEDAIKYSNSLADQIKDCHKDNQLAMHKDIMQSKYSEVQEHAAANIKDYDMTVQAKALDTVYASNNEKAIEAAVTNLENAPSYIQETELPRVTGEAAARNNLIEFAQTSDTVSLQERLASGVQLSQSEFNTLPSDVKREYFANYFKKLPLEQKIKLLSSIPNGAQKKTIYVMIARTDANLFNAIVKDKDRADMLLSMGLPNDVNNKITNVVKFLAVSDVGYQNIAKKHDIEYDNDKKANNSSYTTNPYGFDAKEIYLKDKKGNLMV